MKLMVTKLCEHQFPNVTKIGSEASRRARFGFVTLVLIVAKIFLGILYFGSQKITRIPTVKLKIPGKSIFEIRNQNFCYIRVIVFDFSYLSMAAVGTQYVRYHVKIVKNAFPGIFNSTVGILSQGNRHKYLQVDTYGS